MPDHSQNAHSAKSQTDFDVVIVGAGPGGLMAAEALAAKGYRIAVFDAMPSAGRKLLQAGRGGLNLTHSEPKADFMQRYGEASQQIALWLAQFDADDLRAWAAGLG
ncbi:MAG: NAD(P)/FAD-dependent oxidoreductase, partial [Gammaproteobacteria bacterium]|nr:NAD(P)/FAD-dependent oxidoreductase [Gammaproteobacteria bacterium]